MRFSVIFAGCLFAQSALAGTVTIHGVGTSTCSDWARFVDGADKMGTNSSNDPQIKELFAVMDANRRTRQQWVSGYLSGLASGANSNFLKTVDFDEVYKEISRLCKLKPQSDVIDIISSVANDLMK